jgi:two-component system sensor histidine kinase KdpD
MTQETKLLKILLSITAISSDTKLTFQEKLGKILEEIVACMQATRGSIMLLKSRKSLEVAASTNPDLIGFKQPLSGHSPSGWVVKNKAPLFVDSKTAHKFFEKKAGVYEKSAFLVVPVISDKKVMGVLNVTEKIGEDIFNKGEQEILLQVAGTLIGALETQRLSQSLKKSKSTLAKKNKKLKKLEKLRTDLFNMLIHDLKGPISEVVANLDILSYTANEENRPFVESAQIGCDTLQSMVSNLLDIARFEERRLKLIVERINPEELIREALDRLIRVGEMKDIEFTETIPLVQDRKTFSGDRSVLLRVLQNLLGNAMQYSPPGEKIDVGFEYIKASKIRFFVKDSGPGVPPEHRKAIFEKFTQLDKKTDGRIYTTGLGLTFCKMAVQAHGGKIGVKSQVPAGSCFWFAVPVDPNS